MAQTRESRPAPAQPNIQDVFLNHARREKLPVQIRLMDGSDFEGRVKNFDRFAVIVEQSGADHMIFKHAIATIRSSRPISNYYSSHERGLNGSEFTSFSTQHSPRVILIVLDSVGVGELPDARSYGDEGSDTLGNISRRVRLRLPALRSLGLPRVASVEGMGADPSPRAAFGRMAESSPGKDSVTGHWELMGLVLDRPFPVFPHGFPADVMAAFEERIGRRTLGNRAASGTAIIDELGPEHIRTGAPIVYTSADSVFQIAAHEDVVPVPELYRFCEIAFDLVGIGHGVGRVIARPFVGAPGSFQRTSNRRDFALTPFAPTLLDLLTDGRDAGCRHRQDRGPVCRPRYFARGAHDQRCERHGRSRARARRDTARPDLRQPGRL